MNIKRLMDLGCYRGFRHRRRICPFVANALALTLALAGFRVKAIARKK